MANQAMNLPREFVHYYSMSSLHTPVSLTEYAIRREKFGEGCLGVRREGLLGDSAGQKYNHLQKAILEDFIARPRAVSEPPVERKIKTCTPSAAALTPGEGMKYPPSTLHGNLGTGNTVSHEFPLRKNILKKGTIISRLCERVTTEERRILRCLVQFAVRNAPHIDRILLENTIIAALLHNPPLKMKFFHDDCFALKLLAKMCSGKDLGPPSDASFRSERLHAPSSHAPDCGPSCYCLKYQDAALDASSLARETRADPSSGKEWVFQSNLKKGQAKLLNIGRNIALGEN
eukprot:GEMP01025680.1.p1 GENE.GEMP01025680.1~~GEMP01025680.1.p1  ORF type:complete len:323 (+),score=51.24 GEMP01025680.1:104-970(+)